MNLKDLKLNENAKSLEDFFPEISVERWKKIADDLQALQDKLKEKKGIRPIDFMISAIFSDIPQTDQEFIYVTMVVSSFLGAEMERLRVAEMLKKATEIFKASDKGKN